MSKGLSRFQESRISTRNAFDAASAALPTPAAAPQPSYWNIDRARSPFAMSFAGLYLFTLLLYLRPNDIFPAELGTFPLVKIVAVTTLVMYAASTLMRKQAMTFWPTELKCLLLMMAIGVVLIPWAANRQDSVDKLSDSLEKVAIIFITVRKEK